MIQFVEPNSNGVVSGGYRYNSRVFTESFCGQNDVQRVVESLDKGSPLPRSVPGAFCLYDSLFLEKTAQLTPLSYGLLMHYLPSDNPLLTSDEKQKWQAIEKKSVSQALFVVTTGFQLKKKLESMNSSIATCFPSFEEFVGAPEEPSIRRRFISVSSIQPAKGLHLSLQALNGVLGTNSDWEWCIAGPIGSEAYYRELTEEIESLGLNDKVRFLGSLKPEFLLTELKRSEFFLSSSLFESAPMAPLEALVAGCKVIHSAVGDLRLIKHTNLRTFGVGDVEQLQEALVSPFANVKTQSPVDLITRKWGDVQSEFSEVFKRYLSC